ncbi:unnamed protein product, partial [Scytosiphon promiscuus]
SLSQREREGARVAGVGRVRAISCGHPHPSAALRLPPSPAGRGI